MSQVRKWFAYNGALGGQQNPLNYFYTTAIPPSCALGTRICAIYGVYKSGSGTNPGNFSTRFQLYISDAIANGTPQPPSGFSYVLVKP